jgi:hypothetical protein
MQVTQARLGACQRVDRMPHSKPLTRPAVLPALAAAIALLLGACAQVPGTQPGNAAPAGPVSGKAPSGSARPATKPPEAASGSVAAAVAAAASGASAGSSLRSGTAPGGSGSGPTPSGPPPFATVIKDARRIDGPVTLWQREDKVWIELAPDQFNQPFLLSPKIRTGIGEAWVLGGLMVDSINGAGGPQIVEFVRVYNQVRLQARNTDVLAKPGTPEALAVAASYSASLLGATGVVSAPHPERKSVLIEANPLFLSDMLGVGMMLQRGLRQGYGLDRGNSVITAVRGSANVSVIETQSHYYNGSPSAPSSGGLLAALSGLPTPALPRFLPDSRSLLVGLHYSLAALPAKPMATRTADPRLGLFTSNVLDFSDDLQRSPRQRVVNRWRLEKKDPAADLSDPVQPITFWIDRNVPLAYRETVRSAILEWNKAFEKIGFRGAIAVQQQPDDAPFDTLDFGYASVRWMMNAEPSFGAIGPSHMDPRTGEILDADIAFEGMAARSIRGVRSQLLAGGRAAAPLSFATPYERAAAGEPGAEAALLEDRSRHALCLHAAYGVEQLGYAMDVMEARGELDPDSPVAQQFVLDYVKDAIMHEVGHALGLRHNFRASRVYSEAQLSDPEFTRANGTTGSVMEYNAVNLSRPGERAGVPFQTTLGPYDYWAIEYAYTAMAPGTTPAAEKAELQRIAARSSEPLLAYGTDEDAAFGIDPETMQLDLGSDPIAFAAKRLDIARDLFKRQETRELPPTRDYAVLRRSIGYALTDATRAVGVLVRQIGGVRTLRDFPGTGRDPLQPVDAKVQRQALDLISQNVLATSGLTLSPALQRRLAPDFLERGESFAVPTDFAVGERLLDLQRAVLAYLMSDTVARRVLDSIGKLDRPDEAFQLSELYARLARDVWGELWVDKAAAGARGAAALKQPISTARRELQRDHVNRLANAVLRPSALPRADARGLLREQARSMLSLLTTASKQAGGLDAETRAHLADSADTLRQALAAPLQRQAL